MHAQRIFISALAAPIAHSTRTIAPILASLCVSVWATGCAHGLSASSASSASTVFTAWEAQLQATPDARLWLLGEQHNAPEHQQWHTHTVQWLAQRNRLAGVVIEMAQAGRTTQGVPPDASPEQVQHALDWHDALWPWQQYGPVVMAAVRWGVPVYGGNVPRAEMGAVQRDVRWDSHLSPAAWQRQQEAIRMGHCNVLPESQIVPMTRIQLARDDSLARTAIHAQRPQQTVVLVAGFAHVQRSLGIPTWLPEHLPYYVAIAQAGQALQAMEKEADYIHHTPAVPSEDECALVRSIGSH